MSEYPLKLWKYVLEIKSGRNQKQVENPDGLYPIYGSGGIMGYADNFICNEGSTIIGRKGTINRPIYVERKFWNVDTAFGLSPFNSLEGKFLYYFCLGYDFTKHDKGTTLPSLVKQDLLENILIPVPPIEEQKRIVEILDKAFEGIAQAEANTRRNLINARELFDSYLDKILTDCRWETKQISECFRVKSGNFLPKNKMNNFGEFKVYGGNGVAGQHDQFNLEGKNILIGRVGAKCGNIKTINAKIWLTDNALYISEFLVDFDLDFLSFVLERADLGKTANQTAQPVISYTTIKSVFISYPKATEQQKTIVKKVYKIKDCLQDLEKIYQRKLEAIAELKQSILEKAFTGQLSQ